MNLEKSLPQFLTKFEILGIEIVQYKLYQVQIQQNIKLELEYLSKSKRLGFLSTFEKVRTVLTETL